MIIIARQCYYTDKLTSSEWNVRKKKWTEKDCAKVTWLKQSNADIINHFIN